jgi:ribose transport system ATP-binding protein
VIVVNGCGETAASSLWALDVAGINKRFGSQQVLFDAGLQVRPGEVHALVGHNGSGKSTLVKAMAGLHEPDPGASADVFGRSIAFGDPKSSYDAGLRFVHQDLGLVETLEVVDNVLFGSAYPVRFGHRIDWAAARSIVADLVNDLGYRFDVRTPVGRLSLADRTGVALARAMYQPRGEPRVVVFDEATAALPAAGVAHLSEVVRGLASRGLGVVYISHRLEEIFQVADRVTVLRDGRVVGVENIGDLDERRLIELMVGRVVERSGGRRTPPPDRGVALRVKNMRARPIRNLDLAVGLGEILGVAGVAGSGRDELAGALFGSIERRGDVEVFGHRVRAGRPDITTKLGIGYLPADRAHNGLFHDMTVRENLTIPSLPTRYRGGLLHHDRECTEAAIWVEQMHVQPEDPERPVRQLSGGNQQKVLLARCLRLDPKVLILDEPTQGVDVATVERIYSMVRAAAQRGTAIVVCSSDTDELVRLCDRVIVLVQGAVRNEFAGSEINRQVIDTAALTFSEGVSP